MLVDAVNFVNDYYQCVGILLKLDHIVPPLIFFILLVSKTELNKNNGYVFLLDHLDTSENKKILRDHKSVPGME